MLFSKVSQQLVLANVPQTLVLRCAVVIGLGQLIQYSRIALYETYSLTAADVAVHLVAYPRLLHLTKEVARIPLILHILSATSSTVIAFVRSCAMSFDCDLFANAYFIC